MDIGPLIKIVFCHSLWDINEQDGQSVAGEMALVCTLWDWSPYKTRQYIEPLWVMDIPLCQSTKINASNVFIARTRAQFKISTHVLKSEPVHFRRHVNQPVQPCPHHLIFFSFCTASVVWNERTGQLAAGDVVLILTLGDRPQHRARQSHGSFCGL